MWTEGVWEIVSARQSPTKFLLTDEPVTFFNGRAFPRSKDCLYPNDVGLGEVGTRTIFPLDLETCLIITHLQLVRDPWCNPRRPRINARSFAPTMGNLLDIQTGRALEEDEVLRINLILKRRATRHIAAVESAWLYPEQQVSTDHWPKLDDDWFLIPNVYKVPFTSDVAVGYKDGSSWAMDEHGRTPQQKDYQDKKLHDREWRRHLQAKRTWAVKREGRSLSRVHEFNEAHDRIMEEDLSPLSR